MSDEGKNNYKDSEADMGQKLWSLNKANISTTNTKMDRFRVLRLHKRRVIVKVVKK